MDFKKVKRRNEGTVTFGEDLMRSFWPLSDSPTSEEDSVHLNKYIAIPRLESPRYVVPNGRKSASAVMYHFNSGGTMPTRVRNRVVRGSLSVLGCVPGRSERFNVSAGSPNFASIESRLSGLLDQPIRVGMYFGPPRANRKPILQITDLAGKPIAFAKIGMNEVTRRLVKREHECLRDLSKYALEGIGVPKVRHYDQWNDLEILVLSPLPTWRAVRRVALQERFEAMGKVSRLAGTTRSQLAHSDYLVRLSQDVLNVHLNFIRNPISDILESILRRASQLSFGSWHGDWTQWNMAKADGQFLLWDWERFTTNVPVGFDALHYALRVAVSQGGPSSRAASQLVGQAPTLLRYFGVLSREADVVASLYLIELALRYTRDAQRDAGGRSGKVEDWILPALQSHWLS